MDGRLVTRADNGVIVLGNMPMRATTGITYQLTNTYGRKQTQGDPRPDDHPINSTITQSSWIGGGQILHAQVDQDAERFWWSSLWTQTRQCLALPIANTEYAPALSGNARMLAQFPDPGVAGRVYASWGSTLARADSGQTTFTSVGALQNAPVGTAQVYAYPTSPGTRRLFIPEGSTYDVYDGTTITAGVGGEGAIDMAVWSEKLFKLDSNGVVKYTNDGITWTVCGNVIDGSTPRHLLQFYDASGNPALVVVTSRSIYVLDFTDKILFETDQVYPNHPDQGRGAAMWRGNMYSSTGVGILEQSLGRIEAVGLDRGDGLPPEYTDGYVVDLCPSYNVLFALIQGQLATTIVNESSVLQLGQIDPFYGSPGSGVYTLVGWNGFGWHFYASGNGIPANCIVTDTNNIYRVWWAVGTKVYSQPLVRGYYNPRVNPPGPFALSGYMDTPQFDWSWKDIPKVLKRFQMHTANCTANGNISISYRVDDDAAPFTLLNTYTANGQQSIKFGHQIRDGVDLFYGQQHEWVQFRMSMNRDPATPFVSPIVEWYSVIGRKFLLPQRVWRVQIDAQHPFDNYTTQDLHDHIEDLVFTPGATTLVHKDRLYMVDVTGVSGSDNVPGMIVDGSIILNLIESEEAIDA